MGTFNNKNEYLELIEKYKIIAENTIECIWVFDSAKKCFKYMSPSIINLRGVTVEEAMNQKFEDYFTPDSLKKMNEGTDQLLKFLAGDRSENIVSSIDEFEQYCKDGTIKTIEISYTLIINNETNYVDVLGVSRDITQRKKLALKTEPILKNSFNNVHNLSVIDNGRIYCFGKLVVYEKNSNSTVKWRTSKSEELFAYLLQNRELWIPKLRICEALWPECSTEKLNCLFNYISLFNN